MRWTVLPLLLTGCVSEHQQLLRTWHGVYEVERVTQNNDSCADEGLVVDNDPEFFEIVTEAGEEADLVDLRRCDDEDACERVGFLTFIATRATEKSLSGGVSELFYSQLTEGGGVCQVLYNDVVVTRSSEKGRDLFVEVRTSTATDATAQSAEACGELLETMVDDPNGCDAMKTFEGRRVQQ